MTLTKNVLTRIIKEELAKILDQHHRDQLIDQYDQLEQQLGGIGASQKTAQLIVASLK